MRKLFIIALLGLAACGSGDDSGSDPTVGDTDGTTSAFSAENQTPGVYRDTFKLLDAIDAEEDDATAVERMHADLTNRLKNTESLDALTEDEKETVRGLFILALRSTEATRHHPDVARDIGVSILTRVLELDRARPVWNAAHDASDQVEISTANAALIAEVTESTLQKSTQAPVDAEGQPLAALSPSVASQCAAPTTRAVWSPGAADRVWVPEYCTGDSVLPGYCESDKYVEGYCYDVWVDDCAGGHYENRGYYDYVCYSSSDCRYVWRDRYIWVADNYCDDGYYDQECTSGHYEPGLCYPDTTVSGTCIPGHYVLVYPNGSWSFRSSNGNASCDSVVPAQTAVAKTSAQILSGPLADDISDDSWRAAVQNLVLLDDVPADGSYIDAVVQVIAAAKTTGQ